METSACPNCHGNAANADNFRTFKSLHLHQVSRPRAVAGEFITIRRVAEGNSVIKDIVPSGDNSMPPHLTCASAFFFPFVHRGLFFFFNRTLKGQVMSHGSAEMSSLTVMTGTCAHFLPVRRRAPGLPQMRHN